MTLRDFTKEFLPLPDAEYGPNNPVWRKVFPTNLRWHRVIDKAGYYKHPTNIIFDKKWVEQISHIELEEQWERVHKGEIINTEWRKIYTY